jgi:hypothetical protein
MTLVIFIYGTLVFTIVAAALGLLAWGIVNERRDRTTFGQSREVFGEPTAAMHAKGKRGAATR